MRERIRQFLYGRYGSDHLGRFLNWAAILIMILGIILTPVLSWVGMVIWAWGIFRMFSRNHGGRARENAAYLRIVGRVRGVFRAKKSRFDQREDYRFYKCPACRQKVRVPRGKGKISITCPGCRESFVKKT